VRGRFRKTKRFLFHLAVRSLQLVARALPRRVATEVLARVGDVVRLVDRPAVKRSLAHLEIAYGEALPPAARVRTVREMFRATGRNLVDVLRPFPRRAEQVDRLVRFEGLEHLEGALRTGRGVVALSAHLGNWEVLGAALASRGYPIHVVAEKIFDARSDRILNAWRARSGVIVHRRDRGLRDVLAALRVGHVVGVLVDQDMPGSAVFVDFFGRPARTPRAPFVLARRKGAALVPMWTHRDGDGRHVVTIRPALRPTLHEDPEVALAADVRAWHRLLEGAISAHPEQWVWHHRRWKSAPLAEPMEFSRRLADAPPRRATWEVAQTDERELLLLALGARCRPSVGMPPADDDFRAQGAPTPPPARDARDLARNFRVGTPLGPSGGHGVRLPGSQTCGGAVGHDRLLRRRAPVSKLTSIGRAAAEHRRPEARGHVVVVATMGRR
jgi:KDO2-lipid IV(A) lauroyltransferase